MFQPVQSKSWLRPPVKSAATGSSKSREAQTPVAAAPSSKSQASSRIAPLFSNRTFSSELASAAQITPPAAQRIATAESANANIVARQDSAIAKKSSSQSRADLNEVPPSSAAVSVKAAATAGDAAPPPVSSPIDKLMAALSNLGIDPSSFKAEAREEWVTYPGGGYINRITNVQLPNGMQENFSTDLMSRYPEITATEIARMLRMPNGNPYTGLV